MSKKIVLFDIDYTLFDTTAYKKGVSKELAKLFHQLDPQKVYDIIDGVYYDVRSFGSFDPRLFADIFIEKYPEVSSKDVIEHVWWEKKLLIDSLYPEVLSVLQELSKQDNIALGIFSSGKTEFQLAKISHLE